MENPKHKALQKAKTTKKIVHYTGKIVKGRHWSEYSQPNAAKSHPDYNHSTKAPR